jgi:hypothetical protein
MYFQWLDFVLSGLQEPVVPQVVQSVLANAAEPTTPAATSAVPAAGRSTSRSRGGAATPNSKPAPEVSGRDPATASIASLAVIPPLGHPKNSNKQEVW